MKTTRAAKKLISHCDKFGWYLEAKLYWEIKLWDCGGDNLTCFKPRTYLKTEWEEMYLLLLLEINSCLSAKLVVLFVRAFYQVPYKSHTHLWQTIFETKLHRRMRLSYWQEVDCRGSLHAQWTDAASYFRVSLRDVGIARYYDVRTTGSVYCSRMLTVQ